MTADLSGTTLFSDSPPSKIAKRRAAANPEATSVTGVNLGDNTTADHSFPSPPPRLSEAEAKYYYTGLPSRPLLVARTGTILYQKPTGPEAYAKLKELRIVGNHEIKEVWEDNLAFEVHRVLDENGVQWTSTDVVRFGYVDEPSGGVVLWIGVKTRSLSYEDGIDVAFQCKRVLLDYSIQDVEVEIRESEVATFARAGPKLFEPTFDVTMDLREPFTATLGIPICARSTPWHEGSGGFFLRDAADGDKLLLVTVRHVVFPPNECNNEPFEDKVNDHRRRDVLILSNTAFQKQLDSIQDIIEDQNDIIDGQTRRIQKLEGDELAQAKVLRNNAKDAMKTLTALKEELSKNWATDEDRILGHVLFSPPIEVSAGPNEYTQDIAVIEIDTSKIDLSSFRGNVIDLGTKYTPRELRAKFHPNPKNRNNFVYPDDRLLNLYGTISDDEIRNPRTYDEYGEPCMVVLKRGYATGLTIGRANTLMHYTRNYFGREKVSKEWGIIPFDKSGVFSALGDSGSVIVDGSGRIGGLLTGGTKNSLMESADISYATPLSFVLDTIRSNRSLARAFPIVGRPA